MKVFIILAFIHMALAAYAPICPMLDCDPCPYKSIFDANGCPSCDCVVECVPVTPYTCTLECKYGLAKDENNCVICECSVSRILDCKDVTCTNDWECRGISYGCTGITFPHACDPIYTLRCAPKCKTQVCNDCPSGYVYDQYQCKTCNCKDVCENKPCKDTETCIKDSYAVDGYTCKPNCAVLDCKNKCTEYVKDYNQCDSCTCVDPCENKPCRDTETCIKDSSAVGGYTCKFNCAPMYDCPNKCTVYVKDYNQCDTCKCVDVCENKPCKDTETCIKDGYAVGGYTCKPNCPVNICDPKCTSGYLKDINQCETCSCIDPCEINDCLANQKCVPVVGYKVGKRYTCQYVCLDTTNCTFCKSGYFYDPVTKCKTCKCLIPCENVVCDYGKICVADLTLPDRYRCDVKPCKCALPKPPTLLSCTQKDKCVTCQLKAKTDCGFGNQSCPDFFGCHSCVPC